MVCEIVSPINRTATFWKHFVGFKEDSYGKLIKTYRAFCKVCGQSVAHGSGKTNLRNHLICQIKDYSANVNTALRSN